MEVDKKGFDENKVYWKNLSMIGKICEVNNEKFICMDDKLGVVSWVNAPMLIKEVEFLRNQIEEMKICENCNNAVWEYNWMYSKYHCEQDNCNNYSKWELKK